MADPGFFRKSREEVDKTTAELTRQQGLLEQYFARWQELEG
jgi:hypothetical protein